MIFTQPWATVSRRYGSALISVFFYTQVIFTIPVVGGTLIVTPQNRAVISGQEVEMQCQTDNQTKLKWYSQRPGSSKEDEVQIYSGYGFPSQAACFYAITIGSDRKYTLRFNASAETAQRYTCLEPGSLEAKSAELVVLESDPRCNVTSDDGYVKISCVIVFRGNWAPEMEWTWCNNETVIISDVSHSISPNDRLSSTLTVRRNNNSSGSCYRLTTMFRGNERPLETSADNIPSYNHTFCFKYPDWKNPSERNETQANDSTMHNFTENVFYETLKIIGSITIPMSALFIVIVTVACCCRGKQQNVQKPDASGTLMPKRPTKATKSFRTCPLARRLGFGSRTRSLPV